MTDDELIPYMHKMVAVRCRFPNGIHIYTGIMYSSGNDYGAVVIGSAWMHKNSIKDIELI